MSNSKIMGGSSSSRSEYDHMVSSLNTQIAAQRNGVTVQAQNYQIKTQEIDSQIGTENRAIEQINHKLRHAKTENDKLKQQVYGLSDDISKLTRQLPSVMTDLDKAVQKNSRLNAQTRIL